MRIACQGVAGSYADEAAELHYPAAQRVAVGDLAAVVRAVTRGRADRGLIPVANAIIGAIAEGERVLADASVRIVDELELVVHHCLLARHGAAQASLRIVESHPAALAQCARYIVAHGLAARPARSTADAARAISDDRNFTSAAIASARAAERYGLQVLARDIADAPRNTTRFVVVAPAR